MVAVSNLRVLYERPTFIVDNKKYNNPKFDWLIEALKDLMVNTDKKVLLFVDTKESQYTIWNAIISSEFVHKSGINPAIKSPQVLNGDMPPKDRRKLLEDAISKYRIFIVSPRIANAGLNLQDFNVVIHYSRMWNPSKEAQATARSWRQGQTKPVEVWLPILIRNKNSSLSNPGFDQVLQTLMERKQKLSDGIWTTSCLDISEVDIYNGIIK